MTLSRRTAWCEALRSYMYTRIEGEMHRGTGHCALGLGMHVLGVGEGEFANMLPPGTACMIARMNDAVKRSWDDAPRFRYSWSKIADWIERNVQCVNDRRGYEFIEISRDENSVTLMQIEGYKYLLDQIDWSTVVIEPPKQSETYTGLCKVLDQFKADIAEICT